MKQNINMQTSAAHWRQRIVPVGLLSLTLLLAPSTSHAQMEVVPVNPGPASAAGISGDTNVIALNTPKRTVDSLLGPPRSGWSIPSLCRSMYIYGDNIKIIYFDGCVLSVGLSCNCAGDATTERNASVEYNGRRVYFDPMVLRGMVVEGPIGEIKRDAETCFYMVPPLHVGVVPPAVRPTNWWPPYPAFSRTRQF